MIPDLRSSRGESTTSENRFLPWGLGGETDWRNTAQLGYTVPFTLENTGQKTDLKRQKIQKINTNQKKHTTQNTAKHPGCSWPPITNLSKPRVTGHRSIEHVGYWGRGVGKIDQSIDGSVSPTPNPPHVLGTKSVSNQLLFQQLLFPRLQRL